jgi:adenine-specific DNA-methyltransferase
MALIETQARQHEQSYSEIERKRLGAHYTPDSVVDYIIRHALQPLLNIPDSVKNVRILNPACGSGLFLLKAYEILADCQQRSRGGFGPKDAKHILENCLFGIDIDEQAVKLTKKHLLQKASLSESDSAFLGKNIVVGDALSFAHPSTLIPMHNHASDELSVGGIFLKHSFDCIIGNPPYVRIQNTPSEKRGCYASSCTTATGRFDVSTLFIELSEHLLKDNGRFSFIVSNKILSTAGAKKLRSFLLERFSIEEIIDLADTKLFDAAVLPMILIATKAGKSGNQIAYSSITESHENAASSLRAENVLDLLDNSKIPFEANVSVASRMFKLQRFYADMPSLRDKIWTFHNERENRILSKIHRNAACTLGDISQKISVGLKTTADDIFIKPMTEEFVRQKGLEADLVFPVLESHNINRWTYTWDPRRDLFVLYPHIEQNGKVVPVELDTYPRIKAYLEANRERLEAREYLTKSGRCWYEVWVHQSPSDFSRKKIITPDISLGNRFAFDNKGFFVNGTCFYLILMDESDISYYSILSLLNSKVIEYFHKITSGNSLYAKRFRYWTSYIREYPVAKRLLDSPGVKSLIADNVARLLNTTKETERTKLENENDCFCYSLFDLTEDEIEEIEETLNERSMPSKKGKASE